MGRNNRGGRKMIKPNWTYVDMDGVIADFFKALALEFGVNHWKDIPTQEDVIERLKGTDFLVEYQSSQQQLNFFTWWRDIQKVDGQYLALH